MSKSHTKATRYSDVVSSVISPQGELISIHYHLHTGRIVARPEAAAPGGYHPGILLGMDRYGQYWIAHHHNDHGKPVIEAAEVFGRGRKLMFDCRDVQFDALEVSARAVFQVMEANAYGEAYDAEAFISLCTGSPEPAVSPAFTGGVALLGILSAFLGIIE